jgi:hypothetical protein
MQRLEALKQKKKGVLQCQEKERDMISNKAK